MSTVIRIFLFSLVLFPALLKAQTLTGKIVDSLNGEGIPFARIYSYEADQMHECDSEGSFSITVPESGSYKLRFFASGYEGIVRQFTGSEKNLTIKLSPIHLDLKEITVPGYQWQMKGEMPFHIERRKISELNSIPTINLGEAIAKIPGVYQSSLGNGISKPVIRGMQGMRIVSLINGLRMEGQQWGGDHGMGMAELGIGSVEVIKGPASLLYGADALGGVIYYADAPLPPRGSRIIRFDQLLQSATLGGSSRFMIQERRNKVGWSFGASYTNHADYLLPNGKFAENSRFNELVLKSAITFKALKGIHHLRYTFNGLTTGIPGHTHDSIFSPETFQITNQERVYRIPAQHFSNHYFSSESKWFRPGNDFVFLTGFTSNELREHDEKYTLPSIHLRLLNNLYHFRWKHQFNENMNLISGVQGMFQFNRNIDHPEDTLIPNAQTIDNGIYTILNYRLGKWNYQGGIRYDLRNIQTLHEFKGKEAIQKNFDGFNLSAGAVRKSEKWILRATVSSGFRAPHPSELLSNGFHHGALRYEIGSTQLVPERATQIDLGTEFEFEHFTLHLNPFASLMKDYIYLQPEDSIIEGIPLFTYQQAPEVLIYGGDLALHYHPHFWHQLHLENTLSILDVKASKDSSVSMIPQPRLRTTLRLDFEKGRKLKLHEFVLEHALIGAQNRVAFRETPSQSYQLLDASLSFQIKGKQEWVFYVGCKNILNSNYIDHLSRLKNISMPSPGRNFFLRINYQLNHKLKTSKP
ncbi:MAG: TonB-dependent receptor [Bacteroidetes bacterium]|nr:MAG: TonB-dependent receptor [Bacteroidota bacterium]